MTNDFHFDTEIIIKLNHQRFRISEVPIPTYYGDEICYVNGMRYAKDVWRAVRRYKRTRNSVAKHPEFQEYFVHYPIKHSPHSTHTIVQSLVGHADRILDLGCGNGFLDVELKQQSAQRRITGVDSLSQPEKAEVFDRYITADLDLDTDRIREALTGERFRTVLLLDILEHLKKPEDLLSACKEWIDREGVVIVSVPNVAHLWVRLQLLLGRFDYQERGILDRTHLRFFTRKTMREMVRGCGFRIVKETATIAPVELATGLSSRNPLVRLYHLLSGALARVWPSMFGYQLVLVLGADASRPTSS
jgi:2-polyprenyl-3-methyl-5-hydroxy-6-metoxy-1,4-benzoquinol methylase